MKRRRFLETCAATGAILSFGPMFYCTSDKPKLDILILGGTFFVGPAIVDAALEGGHKVSLFNRGITNPDLFPDLPLIKGDRETGPGCYAPLQNKKWDLVIDVWPEKAKLVEEATEALQGHATHYMFVSSIAVYDDFQEVGLHEASAVVKPREDESVWDYAEQKITAEKWVRQRFPQNHTLFRPGPIKGWRDPAQDLLYWLSKLKGNESILGPGTGTDPLQFINVRDLGEFILLVAEQNLNGVYNCTGPRKDLIDWKEFLTTAQQHLGSTSEIYWPDEAFLQANEVYSFSDLPLWAPLSEDRGFMQISQAKAVQAGLKFRSLGQTIDDCLQWADLADSLDEPGGLDRSRELELIQLWQKLLAGKIFP